MIDENIRLHHEWTLGKPKGEGLLGPATCSATATQYEMHAMALAYERLEKHPECQPETIAKHYAAHATLALNQWRDIAKRLAENGGGLGRYDAGKYLDAIDEYKRMAAMPNAKLKHGEDETR